MIAHSYKKDVMIIDIVFYYTGSYRETQVKAIAILLNVLFTRIAISYRRIRRYSVGRLKRLEACDFSHVRFTLYSDIGALKMRIL